MMKKQEKTRRGNVRENCITVVMTEAEKKAAKTAADKIGVSMSALVRIAVREFCSKEGLR